MTVTVFEYLILIRIDFNNFIFSVFSLVLVSIEKTYQTLETVFHRHIQTPRRELKIRRAAKYFSTKFEVFRNVVKHGSKCLIYLINQNYSSGETKKKNIYAN